LQPSAEQCDHRVQYNVGDKRNDEKAEVCVLHKADFRIRLLTANVMEYFSKYY
jgi:hypothetical protein